MDQQNYTPDGAGKGKAIASLILGIVSLVLAFVFPIVVGLVCGIIGLVMATLSKKDGYVGGMRTAGFILSIIGLILNAIVLIVVLACGAAIGCAAMQLIPMMQ